MLEVRLPLNGPGSDHTCHRRRRRLFQDYWREFTVWGRFTEGVSPTPEELCPGCAYERGYLDGLAASVRSGE